MQPLSLARSAHHCPLNPTVPHPLLQVVSGELFVAERFVGWQEVALLAMQGEWDEAGKRFSDNLFPAVLEAVRAFRAAQGE